MDGKMAILNYDKIIDFGTVYMNTTSKKMIEVKNISSISQVYTVERCMRIPNLDSGFKATPAISQPLKPGKSCCFEIELKPKVANMKISDCFVVRHLFGVETTLFTIAMVEGPECSLSCTQIYMICPFETNKCEKQFEIRNIGNSNVTYNIVGDNDSSKIIINPSQGKVKPLKSVKIIASFTSREFGVFFRRVIFLVAHHEPLVLDICATRMKKNETPSFNLVQTNLPKFKNSYHCFMNNVMKNVPNLEEPLISMDVCYIDFEHCQQKSKKEATFSITNNYCNDVVITWNQTFQKEFSIRPAKFELKPNDSATFIACFQPLTKDKLFSAELEAQLFVNDLILPYPVNISLKGHSFDEASCGWAAQYKIDPYCVVLPPCTSRPFHPSHSSLTIYRIGHLPLAFKFHPPKTTNFTVKPQQGLIQKEFQIILVQFQPKNIQDMVCIEKWMLSFNSNEYTNQCYVEFSASIETPHLIINNGNDVVFPKVHPQSPCELVVDAYNPTRFSFWFNEEILKGDSVIMVGSGGEIWPKEHKKLKWTFCPRGVGELDALVSCTPTLGADIAIRPAIVTVKCVSEETTLLVIPHGLIYEKALCGCEHERGFEISNCGEAIISGSLMWLPGECCSNDDVDVRFEPETFTLKPGSSTLINVFVIPRVNGTRRITIGYSTNEVTAIPIVPVFVNGIYPCIQVSDIRIYSSGPLFSKFDFWRSLQINKLNDLLEIIKPNETVIANMRLPSFMCKSDDIKVELLIENHSDIAVDLDLTHEKSCDCQPVKTAVSFSRSRWLDNCPHKSQVKVFPMNTHLGANSFMVLDLNVSFSTDGFVECLFNISLTPEDYANIHSFIKLNISRFAIPEEEPYLDSIEPKEKDFYVFNMKSVFIGDCYPLVQTLYLHNNSKTSVTYEINDNNLYGTPFKYVGDKNTVPPLSNHGLLFTFLPNGCDSYESFVELILESKELIRIKLKGTGLREKNNDDCDKFAIWNKEQLMSLNPLPVYLSTSHISVGPMKQNCTQRQVLFFNNKTKDILSFKWHVTRLPRLVELHVHPGKAVVQPGSVVECRVVAYSKGRPCDLTCTLTCVWANFSKYQAVALRICKHRDDLTKCADYFIIAEDGEKRVEPAPPLEDWPRKNYLTLSVKINIKYDTVGDESFILCAPMTLQVPHCRDSYSDADDGQKLSVSHIMETVLWEAIDDLCTTSIFKKDEPLERYVTLKKSSKHRDVVVPTHVMQTTIEDLLYSVWQELFQLTPRNSLEQLRRTLMSSLHQYSRHWLGSDEVNDGKTES